MTRTAVLSPTTHLLLVAIKQRGPSLMPLALILGLSETEFRAQVDELVDFGFVRVTSFYADGRLPEGPAIHLTDAGEAIAAELPPGEAIEAVRQPLLRKYVEPRDVLGVSDKQLRDDRRTTSLLGAVLQDPGPVGAVGSWLEAELRRRTNERNGRPDA